MDRNYIRKGFQSRILDLVSVEQGAGLNVDRRYYNGYIEEMSWIYRDSI